MTPRDPHITPTDFLTAGVILAGQTSEDVGTLAAIATDDITLATLAANAHQVARYLLALAAEIVAGTYDPTEEKMVPDWDYWHTTGLADDFLAVADAHGVTLD
jgi:hypothetical protein